MTDRIHAYSPFPWRAFGFATFINFIWINLSEVFRYFVFVMPMMREAFPHIPDIAPMNLTVFAIWGLWDAILVLCVTGFVWIYLERFGPTRRNALIAGSFATLGIFGILWLGLFNMNLATLQIMSIALPLAWLELIVAALIVRMGMKRQASPQVT